MATRMTERATDHGAAPSGASLLCAVGEACFGSAWQGDLARALDVKGSGGWLSASGRVQQQGGMRDGDTRLGHE
jgi:hypothetical protein